MDEILDVPEGAQAKAKAGAEPPWKMKRPFWKKGRDKSKGKGKGKTKGKSKGKGKGKVKGKARERAQPKEGHKDREEPPARRVRVAGRRDLPENLR